MYYLFYIIITNLLYIYIKNLIYKKILGVCIRKLIKQYYKNKEDMISPIQFGQQMIDWTDYRRVLRY